MKTFGLLMSLPMVDARTLSGAALADAMRDSRRRTLAAVADLSDAQWQVPMQPGVNPIAWELAHIGWFAEFWVLRGPHHVDAQGLVHAARAPRHAGPDALFDSARLAHAARWSQPMPSRAEVLSMLDAQLAACLEALPESDDDAQLYAHRLALFHEDMHGEAFAWLRAALAYPPPAGLPGPTRTGPAEALHLPAGEAQVGWPATRRGFAFDNECPAHVVALAAFEIDAAPLSAGRYLAFVEAGGYDEPAFWPGEAGAWREAQDRRAPERWRRDAHGAWQQRWFDRWLPLDAESPLIHVNAYEAEAYCRWAGRRLPHAAEWERAAQAGAFRWGMGVWEWTADRFAPYAGFEPGPYRDYSAPWFGDHRELRGGAFATSPRLHDARYRNFFRPERSDVFAGFRTAAR
jgi:ergothioneine biosynthesis protein EgtB